MTVIPSTSSATGHKNHHSEESVYDVAVGNNSRKRRKIVLQLRGIDSKGTVFTEPFELSGLNEPDADGQEAFTMKNLAIDAPAGKYKLSAVVSGLGRQELVVYLDDNGIDRSEQISVRIMPDESLDVTKAII